MFKSLRVTYLALLMVGAPLASCSDAINFDAEKSSLSEVGGSATSVTHARAVASLFVHEGATLKLAQTAAQNAAAVQAQVQASIASVCPGASITLDGGSLTVTVAFGDSCTLPDVGSVSGTVSAQIISPEAGTIGVAFTFTALTVKGRTLDGTYSMTTSDVTNFTVSCALTSSQVTLTLDSVVLALDGDSLGMTATGPGSIEGPIVGKFDLQFGDVHQTFTSCYPDSGTLQFNKNVLTVAGNKVDATETVAFDSNTPSTGQVQVVVGSINASVGLPSYGSCP
jgi:hypothetical protein